MNRREPRGGHCRKNEDAKQFHQFPRIFIWRRSGGWRNGSPRKGSRRASAALASYLLGRPYWVWTPHGLYKLLLREPNVCRVDVARLVALDAAKLAEASGVIAACDECAPGAPKRWPGAPKPFCMKCGRDLKTEGTYETER